MHRVIPIVSIISHGSVVPEYFGVKGYALDIITQDHYHKKTAFVISAIMAGMLFL